MTLTAPRGGNVSSLVALEDDDRNLPLRQRLLLLDVRHQCLELLPLLRASRPRADLELVGSHLDRRDRAGEQVLIPGWVRRRAVPGGDDDIAIAILPEAEHGYPFLSRLGPGGGQEDQGATR